MGGSIQQCSPTAPNISFISARRFSISVGLVWLKSYIRSLARSRSSGSPSLISVKSLPLAIRSLCVIGSSSWVIDPSSFSFFTHLPLTNGAVSFTRFQFPGAPPSDERSLVMFLHSRLQAVSQTLHGSHLLLVSPQHQ